MPYEKVGDNDPVCIADEVPFEIPGSWEWCRLGFANEIYTGNSINENVKKSKYTNLKSGYNYIATKDVDFSNNINYDNGVKIPFNEANFRIAYKESILLCIEGGSAGRKIALINEDVCFGNKLCCFKQYSLNTKFLYYYLQSNFFKETFKDNTSGIIGGVSVNTIKSLLLPIPPLKEQERIVCEIEKYLPLIDKYDSLETELNKLNAEFPEKLKKSILQQAIQGKLVEQNSSDEPASVLLEKIRKEKEKLIKEGKIKKDKNESIIYKRDNSYYEKLNGVEKCIDDEIPFEIPESWEWCRFNAINQIINGDRGKNYPSKDKLLTNGSIPFISALNLNGINVTIDDKLLYLLETQYEKLNNGKLIKNDLVLCIRGSLGKHGIFQFDKGAISSSLVIIRPIIKQNILLNYIMLFVDSPLFYCEIKKYDNGTAQPNLAANNLEKFIIPLPSLSEQEKIVDSYNKLVNLIQKL